MESGRPPRLRRKSSAFKLSLSRASQASAYAQAIIHTPLPPPTPSLEDPHNSTQDFTFVLPPHHSNPTTSSGQQPSPTSIITPDSPRLPSDPTMFPSSSSSLHTTTSTSFSTAPSSSSSSSTNPTTTTTTGNSSTLAASFPNVPSPSLTSTLELLKQLVSKRITAWTYLRNASQGKVYWFNTVLLEMKDLRFFFGNERMRSRSTRFTILSMSLSSMLEINNGNTSNGGPSSGQGGVAAGGGNGGGSSNGSASEFLRGLLSLVQEFEGIQEDKLTSLSSGGSGGTSSGGGSTLGGGLSGGSTSGFGANEGGRGSGFGVGGTSGGGIGTSSSGSGKSGQKSLFKLTSSKSRSKSGPSPVDAGSGIGSSSYVGGMGDGTGGGSGGGGGGGADFAFSEGPESGYLVIPNIPFELDYFQVLTTTCELLIQVYTKISIYLGGTSSGESGKGGGGALSQGLAEVVLKIDSRLKKLIGLLSKEIDTLARTAIRNELDILGGGVEGWGFEGVASGMSSGEVA
ncbi:hypothetical protein JCM16303_003402 [Sporobolomyces ruberrimus]